jgi:hypothetical protein
VVEVDRSLRMCACRWEQAAKSSLRPRASTIPAAKPVLILGLIDTSRRRLCQSLRLKFVDPTATLSEGTTHSPILQLSGCKPNLQA